MAVLLGGWFYFHLQRDYGSIAAFNRPVHPSFSLDNVPGSFFTGLGEGQLFSDPVRPSLANQFWPKFYAEFWGDHEAYFLVYGRDLRTERFISGHFLEEAWREGNDWLVTNRGRWRLVSAVPIARR